MKKQLQLSPSFAILIWTRKYSYLSSIFFWVTWSGAKSYGQRTLGSLGGNCRKFKTESCFDVQKKRFWGKINAFSPLFIENGFGQCWYTENVSFHLNNPEIWKDEKLMITFLNLLAYGLMRNLPWREYWKFENTPRFERLPGANGRKDSENLDVKTPKKL